jgi:hypothetical protein
VNRGVNDGNAQGDKIPTLLGTAGSSEYSASFGRTARSGDNLPLWRLHLTASKGSWPRLPIFVSLPDRLLAAHQKVGNYCPVDVMDKGETLKNLQFSGFIGGTVSFKSSAKSGGIGK